MKTLNKKDIKEIIQSGHLNILVGSGCSCDFLPLLNDIEKEMNSQVESIKLDTQMKYYKIIKQSLSILDEEKESDKSKKDDLKNTKKNYDDFLKLWGEIVSNRSLHLLNKQINIFTTNFDIFLEDSCERLDLPYNDGFKGQIKPTFKASNFNKIQKFKSLQFDNTSDIPLFNIVKLHGSVTWREENEEILYSNGEHIEKINLAGKTGKDFEDEYHKISVINPNAKKHFETVLHTTYAALLRKFTLELEKENSVLLIFGTSLNDTHIKELLYGVMKSNPTLIVLYFSYSKYKSNLDELKEKSNPNLYIISPKDKFTFKNSTEYLSKIFLTPRTNE